MDGLEDLVNYESMLYEYAALCYKSIVGIKSKR